MRNVFWPALENVRDAKNASNLGSATAVFLGTVTFGIVTLSSNNSLAASGFSRFGYADAVVLLVLAVLIFIRSRIGAMAALGYYLFNQYVMHFGDGGDNRVSPLAIILSLNFLNAVRANFFYHELKQLGQLEEPPEEKTDPHAKRKKITGVIAFAALVILMSGAGAWYLYEEAKEQQKSAPHAAVEDAVKPIKVENQKLAPVTSTAPRVGDKRFVLKSGQVIVGKIDFEDDTYYSIETADGSSEVIIKQDLKQPPS